MKSVDKDYYIADLEDDEDDEVVTFEDDAEEEAPVRRKTKRSGLKLALVGLGYACVVVAVLYLATTIYIYVSDKMSESLGLSDNGEPVIYTKEDLDNAVAAVRSEGPDESALEAAKQEGIDEGRRQITEEMMRRLLDGDTVVDTIRPYYPDRIVWGTNGNFHFEPIDTSLRMSAVTQDQIEFDENGYMNYVVDGQNLGHKGIDVSEYQGNIDWNKVAESGVEFAFVRCAYRGYGTGKLVEDKNFAKNMQGALAAGLHVGSYVFTQATTREEVEEEVNLAVVMTVQQATDVPIVIDVERVSNGGGRMDQLSAQERTDLVLYFCELVSSYGFRPYIYYNTDMAVLRLELDRLEAYPKWFASYSDTLFYPYDYEILQYSNKGKVPGISGDVDMNVSFDAFWDRG